MELLLKFLISGAVVSLFAIVGDLFKPRTFAGLFGAAPTVALATLGLTIRAHGTGYAALEGRSMMAGALALLAYSIVVGKMLLRRRRPALTTTLLALPVWFAVAFGLWLLVLWGAPA